MVHEGKWNIHHSLSILSLTFGITALETNSKSSPELTRIVHKEFSIFSVECLYIFHTIKVILFVTFITRTTYKGNCSLFSVANWLNACTLFWCIQRCTPIYVHSQ